MTPAEAVKLAMEEDLWFRPDTWSGAGSALMVKAGEVLQVPGPRGGSSCTLSIDMLTNAWHCVAPEAVLHERDVLLERDGE